MAWARKSESRSLLSTAEEEQCSDGYSSAEGEEILFGSNSDEEAVGLLSRALTARGQQSGHHVYLAAKAGLVALVLVSAAVVYRAFPGQQGPPAAGAEAGATYLGLASQDNWSCAANPRCVGMTIGACCPDTTGVMHPCCNLTQVASDPPQDPVIPVDFVPAARPNSTGSKKCGHIYCSQEAKCCESPWPWLAANGTSANKYGICGAKNAQCCGILVCGENATCCGGLCLERNTLCVLNNSTQNASADSSASR